MKKRKTPAIAIIFIVIALLFMKLGAVSQRHPGEAHVSRVIDGDTIELSNKKIVRYIGIDTPELRERKGASWIYNPKPYAEAAKDFNKRLVEGKHVRLELDVQKKDKYGRTLAYVYVEDKMINREILKEGYAMIYTYPPNVKYTKEFLAAQELARDNNKGLWSRVDDGIISPFEVRENMGLVRIVEVEVLSTIISEKVLILNCRENFKIVIFKNNLAYFPASISRSPESYFKHKKVKVCGLIQDYKGATEIIVEDPSQLEVVK